MCHVLCLYAPVPGRRVLYRIGGGRGAPLPEPPVGERAKFTRAYPPEEIAAVWRCGDKGTAARVEYAIKKHLNHQQKEQLAAAPDTLAELLPEVGEWGVSAEK